MSPDGERDVHERRVAYEVSSCILLGCVVMFGVDLMMTTSSVPYSGHSTLLLYVPCALCLVDDGIYSRW